MLSVVSLFAGIGGIERGLEMTGGFRTVAQVEKDDYCRRVLAKHWSGVARFDDVREFGRSSIDGAVDVVCGGFPCQPFSAAGKQRGEADDRHLWPEMLRVVQEFKPTWVLGENVPGIIGLFLDQALIDLEAEGYEAWPLVLPALAFDAPHIRSRIFIVAYSEGARRRKLANQTHGTSSALRRKIYNGRAAPQADIATSNGERCRDGLMAYAERKQRSERHAAPVLRRRTQQAQQVRVGSSGNGTSQWGVEPGICRVAARVPHRMDRLRALGNAVVPQVAEHIGNLILAAEAQRERRA